MTKVQINYAWFNGRGAKEFCVYLIKLSDKFGDTMPPSTLLSE